MPDSMVPRPGSRRARRAPSALPPVPPGHPAFLVAVVAIAACAVAAVTYRLLDTDFWQHLAVGREIVRSGKVPDTQIWIWPLFGQPDVTPSWSFRVLLWKLWEAGGMPALFAWRWLVTLLALGLGVLAARRMGALGMSALLVAGWAVLPLRLRVEPRPESVVFVLLALQILLLETLRRAEAGPLARRAARIGLPLVALVWANVHVSYWMGLALQSFYLIDALASGRRGQGARASWLAAAATLALSAAVSFLNPGGWKTLAQPIEYWTTWRHELIYQQISELEPVIWSENVRNLLWLLVAGWPVLILLRARRAGLDLAEILTAATFLYLGLGTRRFLGFLAVVAVPFVARDLAQVLGSLPMPRFLAPAWPRAALVVGLAAGGLALEWSTPFAVPGVGVEPQWRPLAACDFIERHGVRGRAFNHYELGGYLLYRFHPQRDRLPFMDIHQSGTREDRRRVALMMSDGGAWLALDRQHRFDWVLLSRYHAGFDRSTDILDADTSFALVFVDDVAALYVRRAGALAALAGTHGYRVMRAGLESGPGLGQLIADSAGRPLLRAELARLRAESPFHATALSLEANMLYHEGRLAEAREALRATLAIDPTFARANARLADAALALGRPAEALSAVARAMETDGRSPRLEDVRFAARGRPGPPDEPIVRAVLPDGWRERK